MANNFKAESPQDLPSAVEMVVAQARQQLHPVVLVTGVFDVLHQEHMAFLRKAKALGGVLIVGLESDMRVRQIKGEGRPINTEVKRVKQLQALNIADVVFILPENFNLPEERRTLIHHLRPTYLAVSSHSPHLEAKQQLLAEVGGEVKVVHQHNPEVSTTQLLQRQS